MGSDGRVLDKPLSPNGRNMCAFEHILTLLSGLNTHFFPSLSLQVYCNQQRQKSISHRWLQYFRSIFENLRPRQRTSLIKKWLHLGSLQPLQSAARASALAAMILPGRLRAAQIIIKNTSHLAPTERTFKNEPEHQDIFLSTSKYKCPHWNIFRSKKKQADYKSSYMCIDYHLHIIINV